MRGFFYDSGTLSERSTAVVFRFYRKQSAHRSFPRMFALLKIIHGIGIEEGIQKRFRWLS